MRRGIRIVLCLGAWLCCFAATLFAQEHAQILVFYEPNFPAADTAPIPADQLQKLVSGAQLASTEKLKTELSASETKLLVLAYGSAFPEAAWGEIYSFLRRG